MGVRALSSSLFFFPLSYFVQRLQYPNAWNRLCRHGQRAVGLLEDMSSFLCPAGWVLRMISSDRDDRGIFGGLKFSISGFFWVGKFCQVFFSLGSLIKVGIFWVFKTIRRFVIVISFVAFWKFLWLGNSSLDFLGDFLRFCLKP